MISDRELLRRYADTRDETAFAEVVHRQADLVYSTALRVVCGDAHLAQDITQEVFSKLSSHTLVLSRRETIVGWLHTTTRHTAIKAIRQAQRRQIREQQALIMQDPTPGAEINWEMLRPMLDEAVDRLRELDRDAIILRFFNGLSHREVGAVLGLNEDTARKRVERSLEKLRIHFSRRGITVSSLLLAQAMSANAVQAAPAGLANSLQIGSVAAARKAGLATPFFNDLFFIMKTKIITISTIVVIASLTTIGVWWRNQPAAPAIKKMASTPIVTNVSPAVPTRLKPLLVSGDSADAPAPPATTVDDEAGAIITDQRVTPQLVLANIIQLLNAKDYDTMYRVYVTSNPHTLEILGGQSLYDMKVANPVPPEIEDAQMNRLQHDLESIKDTTPIFDADGTHATYTLPSNGGPTKTMIFTKINGQWYFNRDA